MTCLIVILSLGRVCAVPDVTVVPVSPSSVFTECSGSASWGLDWEFVEPQSSPKSVITLGQLRRMR